MMRINGALIKMKNMPILEMEVTKELIYSAIDIEQQTLATHREFDFAIYLKDITSTLSNKLFRMFVKQETKNRMFWACNMDVALGASRQHSEKLI